MSKSERFADIIKGAYRIIGRATPINADCGELCGAACCKDGGNNCGGIDDVVVGGGDSGGSSCGGINGGVNPSCGGGGGGDHDGEYGTPVANERLGMILFPGEDSLLSGEPGFRLYRARYMGERAWLLVCDGTCDRRKRPLACRVFPLAPDTGAPGSVAAIPDLRARRMCPLADGVHIDPAFRRAVAKAFRHLASEPAMYDHMRLISAELADLKKLAEMLSQPEAQSWNKQ